MKKLFTLFACIFFSLSFYAQPGFYILGFMQNAPSDSVEIDLHINTMPEATATVYTDTTGNIITTWVPLPNNNWNVIEASFVDCNDSLQFQTFYADSLQNNIDIPIDLNYCFNSVYGCTDPNALNYNPDATVDNGSCIYGSDVENDLCENAAPLQEGLQLISNEGAGQNEGIWGECWGFGNGEGEQTSIWYSFTTPVEPAAIHIEAFADSTFTFTDTQFGLYEECGGEMIYCDGNAGQGLYSAFDFECGELDTNQTYLLLIDGWNGDVGTCYLSYSVQSPCSEVIYGCIDSTAVNYNPEATVNDGSCEYACEENDIVLQLNTQDWGGEISWAISGDSLYINSNTQYGDDNEYVQNLCLPDGCYTFEMYDTYGDGWNGATFEITLGDTILASGTLYEGFEGQVNFGVNENDCGEAEVYGCTDPNALNYNPNANVDDGSCVYEPECQLNNFELCFTGNYNTSSGFVFFDLYYEDSLIVNSEATIQNPCYDSCLPDGCYTLQVSNLNNVGDPFFIEGVIHDSLTVLEGVQTGADTLIFEFGINSSNCGDEEIYGCTDPNAQNYNPDATIDDGSCEYSVDCNIEFTVTADSSSGTVFVVPSDNIFDADSILWTFGDGTASTDLFPEHIYSGDGPYNLCLYAVFISANGETCNISYCVELSASMVGGPGFVASGFTVNMVEDLGILSVDNSKLFSEFSLYPNPAKDRLFIKYVPVAAGDIKLSVTDVTGKVLKTGQLTSISGLNTHTIDVDGLNQGVYILSVQSDRGMKTSRFVIGR